MRGVNQLSKGLFVSVTLVNLAGMADVSKVDGFCVWPTLSDGLIYGQGVA